MKKAFSFLALAAMCMIVAFHYFSPDFASITGGPSVCRIDRPLPHAVLSSISGDPGDMSVYKGKVVLLAFWATWCPACVREVPTLIKLQQDFANQNFTVIAVAVDDSGPESLANFINNRRFDVSGVSVPIHYPVLLGDHKSAHELGAQAGLPNCVLVNRDGREVKAFLGVQNEGTLSKAIQELTKN